MATVSLAKLAGDVGLEKPAVAIKQLLSEHERNEGLVAALLDEARLVSFIHHPNVVPIVDVIASASPLVVMEYVFGETLSSLLSASVARGRRMPVQVAVAIAIDVLEGLHAAHEATDASGVPLALVHRDVSPQNILVGADGTTRVTDFGVAKAAVGRVQKTTEHGVAKGKLMYMAPEQFGGKGVDRRTDIWALGVVLWEMLTGRCFMPDSSALYRFHVAMEPARAPGDVALSPSASLSALDAVVLRALEHSPDARYATARDMAIALESAMAPASARRVADLVRHLASDRLREKEAALRALNEFARRSSNAEASPALPVVSSSDRSAGRSPERGGDSAPTVFAGAAPQRTTRFLPPAPSTPRHAPTLRRLESFESIPPVEVSARHSRTSSQTTERDESSSTSSLRSAVVPLTATVLAAILLSVVGWRFAAQEVASQNVELRLAAAAGPERQAHDTTRPPVATSVPTPPAALTALPPAATTPLPQPVVIDPSAPSSSAPLRAATKPSSHRSAGQTPATTGRRGLHVVVTGPRKDPTPPSSSSDPFDRRSRK